MKVKFLERPQYNRCIAQDSGIFRISKLFLLLAVPLSVTLGGCSGGAPSDADILAALNAQAEGMLDSVKKMSCNEAKNSDGYNCDIETTIVMFGNEVKNTSCIRFIKSDDGWKAVAPCN